MYGDLTTFPAAHPRQSISYNPLPAYNAPGKAMQAALPALLLVLGGLSEGGEASFWPSSLTASSRAPSTPWDEAPCVDLDWLKYWPEGEDPVRNFAWCIPKTLVMGPPNQAFVELTLDVVD